MTRNGTPNNLKPQQERALDQLLAGNSVTTAAKAAGVGRRTLHRWLGEDVYFKASYNRRRRELREMHQARLAYIVTKALRTVEKAVEDGDVAISMRLLAGLGFLPGEEPQFDLDDPRMLDSKQRLQEVQIKFGQTLLEEFDDQCSLLETTKSLVQEL